MSWVNNELKPGQIKDKRLEKRLALILESLSENPEESIPAACHGWGETQAVYRFLDNDKVGLPEILEGHKAATVERIGQQQCVLLCQDTTFLTYSTEEPTGLGTLKHTQNEEYLLHPTVAFTPDRVNLGILGAKFWQRPEEPVAAYRASKPIEEKESYRWLESYDLACEVQRECPDTLVISVADREGDIHEWFLDAQNRSLDEKAEFLVRAKCNRRTENETQDYSYLWDELSHSKVLGEMRIKTPRRGSKPSRTATLKLRALEVELVGKAGRGKEPVTLTAVYAREHNPPKGESPIDWMLLTSLPVEDFQGAQTIVGWYKCRWEIEIYFRVIKQGCQIEKLRLEKDSRLLNAIGIYLIVGWRIHNITMQSRSYPETSCNWLFSEIEWKTIYLMQARKQPPKKAPPLRTITRMLAQLGGFLARKGDGEPGIKNVWRGYRALQNYIDAIEAMRTLS